jgi:beta-glucosidase-like glycosyl hydrolase
VVASPKHFTGYSLETGDPGAFGDGTNVMHYDRSNYSGDVTRFDFEDTYLPPWRATISTGGALGIMCSYDAPAHIPSCANKGLMVDILQTEYGLQGPIVTESLPLISRFFC